MEDKDDITTTGIELLNATAADIQEEQPEAPADTSLREELKATEQKALNRLMKIKDNVSEEEQTPTGALTLRKILGGDILSTEMVRRQIWLFLLIMVFTIAYVAVRYQCQQDLIKIDRLNRELKDAKYKALSSSSTLTEHCRESKVLELLKQNRDSLLKISDQPPYIVTRNE